MRKFVLPFADPSALSVEPFDLQAKIEACLWPERVMGKYFELMDLVRNSPWLPPVPLPARPLRRKIGFAMP